MMNKKYGVLVHGAGWVATQHVQAFLNNPYAEVVAISSQHMNNARRLADEYGLENAVSVNLECIHPYAFPVEIFGDRGLVKNNRLWSHSFPDQKDWVEISGIRPDSSDVSHHPFQGQMDHFIQCLQEGVESPCNLEDAVKTHEVEPENANFGVCSTV